LVTVSDKKLVVPIYCDPAIDRNCVPNTIIGYYYKADVITAGDYAPFGMALVGRKFAVGSGGYRYGFNGQENSKDVSEANYTAEYWEYDSRIGRRWNVDPVYKHSPYECFAGNPILFIDQNGADTIKHRIFDNKGNAITKPTVIDLAASETRGIPGMKVVGNNRVEVTPGTYAVDYIPNNCSKINDFNQIAGDYAGGHSYTWKPGHIFSPPPPILPVVVAAVPITQFNTQIIGVTPVNGVVGVLNVNLGNQQWLRTGVGNTFVNPTAARGAIAAYARQLRNFGITSTNLTIGTSLASATTPDDIPGRNGAGVIRDRATTVRGILNGFGIRVGTVNPIYGQSTPVVTAQTNANQVGITGWNVTTQAMQRQVLRGNVVPGSTQPVSGNPPAINFQRNRGRAAPGVGGYTGAWQ
jgi:hypothetical protein